MTRIDHLDQKFLDWSTLEVSWHRMFNLLPALKITYIKAEAEAAYTAPFRT